MVRWHAGKALAGATGGWIDLRGQPSGCGRRGTGRVRSCSEGDICRRLRDMPDHHTLNLRQRRDAGCMMFERGVSRLTLGSSGSSTPGSRCGSDRSSGGDEQYPSGSRGPGCWARTNCPPTMPGGRCAATGPSCGSLAHAAQGWILRPLCVSVPVTLVDSRSPSGAENNELPRLRYAASRCRVQGQGSTHRIPCRCSGRGVPGVQWWSTPSACPDLGHATQVHASRFRSGVDEGC
jgi:hypothetical protein